MVPSRFILGLALLLAASSVSAAVTIDLGPSDYRNWGTGTNSHTSGGLRSSSGQTIRMPPLNSNLNVTRNAVIPYNSLANGMRNFVRVNPASVAASAAITGLFLAVDWVFDQSTGQWMKEGQGEIIPQTGIWKIPNGQGYDELSQACIAHSAPNWDYSRSVVIEEPTRIIGECYGYYRGGTVEQRFTAITMSGQCPAGTSFSVTLGACVGEGQLIELNESDWSELAGYLPSADPNQVGTAGHDTQRMIGNPLPGYTDVQMEGPSSITGNETTSTTTDPVTGDTVVTNTTTTTNITYGDTTITTSNTTTTNTYTNGNHTSTTTTTEMPGEIVISEPSPSAAPAEWPGFCDWASVVCDWLDWTQEPFEAPDVEWPIIEDEDFGEEFNFNLPAQCPEPYTIQLALFPPVQFNWQPFCDLATFIKPLVLASAAIFAAFISLGIARART